MTNNRDQLVDIKIVNGQIRITVGVDVVAHAAKLHPELQEYDQQTGEWRQPSVDADTLANDVVRTLRFEQEDGTTLVHEALDKAIMAAVEDGSYGIEMGAEEQE